MSAWKREDEYLEKAQGRCAARTLGMLTHHDWESGSRSGSGLAHPGHVGPLDSFTHGLVWAKRDVGRRARCFGDHRAGSGNLLLELTRASDVVSVAVRVDGLGELVAAKPGGGRQGGVGILRAVSSGRGEEGAEARHRQRRRSSREPARTGRDQTRKERRAYI